MNEVELADSILHEHMHDVLRIISQEVDLVKSDAHELVSPWKDDLRPPIGLLNALWVFGFLLEFRSHIVKTESSDVHEQTLEEYNKALFKGIETAKANDHLFSRVGNQIIRAIEEMLDA